MNLKKFIFFTTKPLLMMIFKIFFHKKYLKSVYYMDYRGYIWSIRSIIARNILRLNVPFPFPCHHSVTITNWRNINFDPNDLNNFQSPGCYFQCSKATITIGSGAYIAPNVALITSNHSLNNLAEHEEGKQILISKKCWIGFGSVVLPGVYLAPGTIVGANSVVRESVYDESTLIAGSPAVKIKQL